MPDISDNQYILNAILGTGAQAPPSTLGVGFPDLGAQQPGQAGQPSYGGQLPQMGAPLDQNANFMGTMQRFFSGPQSTFHNPTQTQPRHAVGRDSWQSGIGLDHAAILENIGLPGRK